MIKKQHIGYNNKIGLKKICTIMKMSFLFLFLGIGFAYADNTYSQTTLLTLNKNNVPVKEIFSAIENQSEYIFFYQSDAIDESRRVNINVKNQTIEKILEKIFKGTDNVYSIDDRQVYIANAVPEIRQTPMLKITGTVYDENGEAVPGATVSIKGITGGVITDKDGKFGIDAGPKNFLEVNFVGYQTYTILIGEQRNFDIRLQLKANELDEITVVAFGKQKKTSVVSSIETVNMKDLKIPSANLTNAFAGKIPGIISYQTTGEPGADNAQFFVRGVTTFGYKKDPLILIDGFETTANDLARIQPDDIESFSVLKDASATALYGARGANGIILVNTKAGQEGKVKVNARLDVNMATPTRIIDLADGVTYMNLYNEALYTRREYSGIQKDFYDTQKILGTQEGKNQMLYPNVNWYSQLFNRQTYNTKANINVSGGGVGATYYVAGGFDHETGLLKVDKLNDFNNNIDINRFHIRSNAIFRFNSTTSLDTRIMGRFERFNGPYTSASDIFRMVMSGNPVDYPAVWRPDEANLFTKHTLFGTAAGAPGNPYAEMVKGYENRDESTITAQATLEKDFDALVKGLKAQLKVSANVWSYYSARRHFNPYFYALDSYDPNTDIYKLWCTNPQNPNALLGNVEAGRNSSGHYYFEARINWDRQFGKHNVGLMTVGMAEEYVLTAGNSSSIFETLPERNLGNSGRMTYGYDNRYFAEFSYGYNGSEKFAPKHRFGFFPSIGGGWLVSSELFYGEGLKKIINTLKLKGTYGLVGNDAIAGRSGRFFYLSNVTVNSSNFSVFNWGKNYDTRYSGYQIIRYANPEVSWEVAQKLNLGIELALFPDGALKIQSDAFQEIRDNVYMRRNSLPASAGFSAPIEGNIGKIKSKGVEGSIDYQHFFHSDFWVTGRANLTYATNEYLELDELNYTDTYRSQKGHHTNQAWGYVAERLFIDQPEIDNSPRQSFGAYMPGDIKYRDINGDGVINEADMIPIGYPTVPEIQYGFGLSAGYKKMDFSFFFQGNARVSFFIDSKGIAPFEGRRNAIQIVADDYWSETRPNVHAFWPRLSPSPLDNNTQQSTWWLRDGKFIRLKTVELGYNISLKKYGLTNSRIYLSAENLFSFSAFKMWDPEMGSNGLAYPINRRFNAGIQVSF